MNIGAYLSIPTKNAQERPQYSHPLTAQEQQEGAAGVYDPFEVRDCSGTAQPPDMQRCGSPSPVAAHVQPRHHV